MKRQFALLVTFVLGFSINLYAECTYPSAKAFPEFLTQQKRHREAELEYERLAIACAGRPEQNESLQRMMDSALQTGDYTFSLKLARAWMTRLSPEVTCSLVLGESRSLYGLNNEEAVMRQSLPTACSVEYQEELTYIKGLSLLRLRQWPSAIEQFESLKNSNVYKEKTHRAVQIADRGKEMHWKSPGTAAGLSVVLPGSGYWYARKPQTAAAAFIVTGLFAGGTYSAAHAGETGLAVLLGLFSFAWYFGGIRGSAQAAVHTNQYDLQQLIEPVDVIR